MRPMKFRRWNDTRRVTEFRVGSILPAGDGFEGCSVALIDVQEDDLFGEVGVLILAPPQTVRHVLNDRGATLCAMCPSTNATIGGRPGLIAWIETSNGELVGTSLDDHSPTCFDRPKVLH